MSEIKPEVNVGKLRIIADIWRKANIPGNNVDINKATDDILKIIDSEPLLREVCIAFLYSVSTQARKDPNFDRHGNTAKNVANVNTKR